MLCCLVAISLIWRFCCLTRQHHCVICPFFVFFLLAHHYFVTNFFSIDMYIYWWPFLLFSPIHCLFSLLHFFNHLELRFLSRFQIHYWSLGKNRDLWEKYYIWKKKDIEIFTRCFHCYRFLPSLPTSTNETLHIHTEIRTLEGKRKQKRTQQQQQQHTREIEEEKTQERKKPFAEQSTQARERAKSRSLLFSLSSTLLSSSSSSSLPHFTSHNTLYLSPTYWYTCLLHRKVSINIWHWQRKSPSISTKNSIYNFDLLSHGTKNRYW